MISVALLHGDQGPFYSLPYFLIFIACAGSRVYFFGKHPYTRFFQLWLEASISKVHFFDTILFKILVALLRSLQDFHFSEISV